MTTRPTSGTSAITEYAFDPAEGRLLGRRDKAPGRASPSALQTHAERRVVTTADGKAMRVCHRGTHVAFTGRPRGFTGHGRGVGSTRLAPVGARLWLRPGSVTKPFKVSLSESVKPFAGLRFRI